MARSRILAALAGAILASCGGGAALADAIDGDWCLADKHFSIKGPEIVTPGGAKLTGQYTRHAFRYDTPAPEVDAGKPVIMQLMNETTLRLHVGEDSATPWEIWRRCDVTS